VLAGEVEDLPAGGEHGELIGGTEQPRDQWRRADDLLQVVEDQQHPPRFEERRESVLR